MSVAACGSSRSNSSEYDAPNTSPSGAGGGAGTDATGSMDTSDAQVGTAGAGRGAVEGGSTATDGSSIFDASSPPMPLEDLQRAYVDLRFGMFLHFGILTYTGTWSQANLDITQFNPTKLDPEQWADAAVAAHMKFGVLTTRHHDGFALWPSAASNFNVGHIPWMGGKGDVVRAFVDAFRKKGLVPGLYYSVWDNTEGIGNGPITPAQLAYVTQQITELLTNYGPIAILVFDGWSWKMGHNAVAYEKIRQLVKSLQPNCLLTDHTHLASPWDVDIVNFEEPTGTFAPPTNTYAATQEQKINASGGNDWFWAPSIGNLMTSATIVDGHLKKLEPLWTNFLLNCPPNRDGLLDATIVSRLAEVGMAWTPNAARAPLPPQGPQIERPYTPVAATATSGVAQNAIDGINDTNRFTIWQTAGTLPQSITLDLGQARADVGMLACVPRYAAGKGITDGNVTSYIISTSTDGSTFAEAARGTWPADGAMKVATFPPATARYVRFDVVEASGGSGAVTEITVGAASGKAFP
jgi:alpha-L-fucosidase